MVVGVSRGCGQDTVTSSSKMPPISGSAEEELGRERKMAWTNTTTTDAPEEGGKEENYTESLLALSPSSLH